MTVKNNIIGKLNKLASKLDELGMVSEADRIDTISKLLAPGEAWYCPIELDDPMDNFFDFLKFTKNICNNDSSKKNSAPNVLPNSKITNPGDIVVELLEGRHKEILDNLKKDLDNINYADDNNSLGEVFFEGSLKLRLPPSVIDAAKDLALSLPDDAKMLKEEKMHVTLIHQSILKPHRENIKKLFREEKFPNFSKKIELEETLVEAIDDERERRSWRANVKNQSDLQDYVDSVMEMLGEKPSPEDRTFHVTIANLTGKSSDSVA